MPSSTAAIPASSAATQSASPSAGLSVMSSVGLSKSRGTTVNAAPSSLQSWLMAAPPASKLATICAVTAAG